MRAQCRQLTDGYGPGGIFQVARSVGSSHDTRGGGEEETEKEGEIGRYVGDHLEEMTESGLKISNMKFYISIESLSLSLFLAK